MGDSPIFVESSWGAVVPVHGWSGSCSQLGTGREDNLEGLILFLPPPFPFSFSLPKDRWLILGKPSAVVYGFLFLCDCFS